jgi:adenosylcobinamide kinase/adenosylcobinamide-phosphate guanylyltransferase
MVLRTQTAAMLTVVTGPVRAGKSTFALELARASGRAPIYLATAEIDPGDPEMTQRVARHRAERGTMRTLETNEGAGPRLGDALARLTAADVAIVDSLGTWLSSYVIRHDADLDARGVELRAALAASAAEVIVVAEETGWGVVPPTPLGRAFRDALGRLTAALARDADRAYLVVAGFAVDLRAVGQRVTGP